MAILESLPACIVSIRSNNADLPEYVDSGEWTQEQFLHLAEDRRSQKYVECETGAEFQVCVEFTHEFGFSDFGHDLTTHVIVDGDPIARATCKAAYFNQYGAYKQAFSEKLDRASPTQECRRVLMFSVIKKVDDPDSTRIKNDAKLLTERIGEIVVTIFRTTDTNIDEPIIFSRHQPPTEISEKALKGRAISNRVSYGKEKIISRGPLKAINYVDGLTHPVAVFIFKYRSRADLQAEMIIPRTPTPSLEADETVSVDGSSRNSGNLPISREARLANLKREIEEIKAEDNEGGPSRKKSRNSDIPRKGSAIKTSRGANGIAIIDLTDD